MLLTFQAAAKIAAFLSVLGSTNARSDTHLCEGNGPFQLTKMYGKSQDDIAFCDTKWDKGISVTGIQMWSTKWHVKAFQLTYSDGTKGPVHGDSLDTEGNSGNWYGTDQKTWKEGDLVTDVHMAANYWGNGDGMGGITMQIAGQKFEVKSDIGSFAGEPQSLASGLLIGAYGSAGGFVNSFGLVFLSGSVGKSEIVGMDFPMTIDDMNKQQTGVDSVTLNHAIYKNSSPAGSANQTYTFSSSHALTKSRTFTNTYSNTFGFSISQEISAKVGVPEVAEITASTSTTLSYEHQAITSTADMKQDAATTIFTQGGSVAPGFAAVCSASSLSGTYSTDYTNVVKISLSTGQTFTINRPGHFDAVGYTQAVIDCKDVAIKDLPDSGKDAKEIGNPTKRALNFNA